MLLRKGVYPYEPYEYMDSWGKFNETSLPDKEAFYSNLNLEGITEVHVDHRHTNRVFKGFNNKNLGDYHDLYVQSDTILLADIFQHFTDQCLKIYDLDPVHFLSASWLAWQACLKNKSRAITSNRSLPAIDD